MLTTMCFQYIVFYTYHPYECHLKGRAIMQQVPCLFIGCCFKYCCWIQAFEALVPSLSLMEVFSFPKCFLACTVVFSPRFQGFCKCFATLSGFQWFSSWDSACIKVIFRDLVDTQWFILPMSSLSSFLLNMYKNLSILL